MRPATSILVMRGSEISCAVAEEQRGDICLHVKPGAFLCHVVGDDHVYALAAQFFARVRVQVLCLRGKTNQNS